MRLDLRGPVGDRRFVEHVARRGVIVHAHFVPEPSAEQNRGGNVENLSREIPQRHLDAADGAQQIVRRAVGARSAQVAGAFAHLRVELVDLERILSDEPRLHRKNLLLHADARRAVRLRDAVESRIRRDLDEGVVAARTLHQHPLHVANLHALPLGGRERVKRRQERGHERRGTQPFEKLSSRKSSNFGHGPSPPTSTT